jgi:adenosylmethionine-8-amino-7-oxononanoate aminotransferase
MVFHCRRSDDRLWKNRKIFATDYLVEKPDMMCLSKALTGGTIPMVLHFYTRVIWCFYDDDINKALFHGHTFYCNPTVARQH